MEHVFKQQDIHSVSTTGSVAIDCKDLMIHPHVAEKLPNLHDEISQKPENIISCLGKSVDCIKYVCFVLDTYDF